MVHRSLKHLANATVANTFTGLVACDRTNTAELLLYLGEIGLRRLHVAAGYPSLFAYCVGKHGMSEDVAYKRIRVARAARRFPMILDFIADGRLHLSAVVVLSPHLAPENVDGLLAAATHKTKFEVEQLIAHQFPKADIPTTVRPMRPSPAQPPSSAANQLAPGPVRAPAKSEAVLDQLAPGPVEGPIEPPADQRIEVATTLAATPAGPVRAKIAPLAPQRFAVHMTIDQETHDLLVRAQQLLSHQIPAGDVPAVLARALRALITQLEKRKFAATDKPRAAKARTSGNSRHIPSAVKRAVRKRDGGRCTFVSDTGHRCESRTRLEFDHIVPVARGGQTTVGNLRLRCRAHNQYEAERAFGQEFMSEKRRARGANRCWGGPNRRGRGARLVRSRHRHAAVPTGTWLGFYP